jgi:hypothetical protein
VGGLHGAFHAIGGRGLSSACVVVRGPIAERRIADA